MACVSCESITNKYKCPKCFGPYCSLVCYKKHKELEDNCKDNNVAVVPPTQSKEAIEEPTLHEPFRTEDTVAREKLEQLRHSEQLRNLLYNPHLRSLLNEIDVAPNAWTTMRVAMQEPLFVEFADACLKVVEPMSPEEQAQNLVL